MVEFVAWPKIPRGGDVERVVITEKIDGTNACIIIQDGNIVGIQSRKRLITPTDDNYGFASWVTDNREELIGLGEGYHYGEWAGEGIQRNPLGMEGKSLFLFNTFRWGEHNPPPSICKIVPVIYDGPFHGDAISDAMKSLDGKGAEGVVAYFCRSRRYEKHTFELVRGKWRGDKSNAA